MKDKNDGPPGAPPDSPPYRGKRIYLMAAGGTAFLAAVFFLGFGFLYRSYLGAVLQMATAALLLALAFKLETERERAARQTLELEEKDAHIAALVNNVADPIVGMDTKGIIRSFNLAAEKTFGFSAVEAVGKSVALLMPEPHRSRHLEYVERYLRTGQARVLGAVCEIAASRRDGSTFPADLAVSETRLNGRREFIGIIRDVSERKRAADALRKSEENFRKVFDNTPVGIAMAGLDQKFIRANKALVDMLGYGEQELCQLTVADVAFPQDIESLRQCAESMVRGETESCRVEKRFIKKSGEFVWCNVGAALFKDAKRASAFFLIMLEDITHRKLAEEKLQLYREHLEDVVKERTEAYTSVNKELEAFNFSVSHDLRAPLRRISGLVEIALEERSGETGPPGKALLERIDLSCNHMKRLIDDLLRLSQLTLAALDPVRVNLSRQAREIVEELKETHPERRVDVFIEEGLEVTGDHRLLRVALGNLLGNAWKYTQKRDGARIEFGKAPHNGDDCFYVRDNGVGFDMEHAGQLFAPFRRLHSEDEFPGTGIGLCTVQRIVLRHNGKVWAEAAPDQGAVFYFSLPGQRQRREPFLGKVPPGMDP
ncbi:MAG: PAS domain S-box protein [Nitrospinae bacterium]|nr:PAS domain S-box protein [Nitrospinota bacterium]